ncbi:MAG: PAS domain S-box protein, partial [Acetobacteraceae bacterium]|nr:PAS domain S-box protein [Acetobacteraceae bacterium]
MLQSLTPWLFEPNGLSPHGFCLLWEPWLIWSHALGNLGVALAYFSIPFALVRFVRRRDDLVFKPVFWLFAAFILLCGTGHLVDLVTLWLPLYRLDSVVKLATAGVSLATAAALWPLLPRALALPSQAQLSAANAALAASEARYRASFLHSPMPLHTQDGDGVITGVSDRWIDLLGHAREEVIGRNIVAFLAPDSREAAAAAWRRLLAEGEIRDVECRLVRRDGQVLDVLVSARTEAEDAAGRLRVLGALVDVTDRKRAEAALRESEERMRQTQKLEALGQLAGGVAHDFNNVLQAVAGGAALIRRRAEDAEGVRRLAGMIGESATRGAATCRRLLAFARRTDLQAGPVPPTELLGDLREILAHTIGAGIAVQVQASPALPPLLA